MTVPGSKLEMEDQVLVTDEMEKTSYHSIGFKSLGKVYESCLPTRSVVSLIMTLPITESIDSVTCYHAIPLWTVAS